MTEENLPERRPELRVSHEDRDRVAEQLRVAAGDGRLTLEELDERLDKALSARTESDLAALVTDLPAVASETSPVPSAKAKDLVRIEVGSSSVSREGEWIVPRAMDIAVRSGNVKLDLTRAVISHGVLRIAAQVKSGNVKVRVPRGPRGRVRRRSSVLRSPARWPAGTSSRVRPGAGSSDGCSAVRPSTDGSRRPVHAPGPDALEREVRGGR
ncbi:DUF1707 SHOCT-like domain-containing protein [Actinomadura rupiterrae]|uniref:DUF1707 SHOCT-like domain-containing protein n=1 Tax=Actinomadura rupiterrae TaxID=559627 RepID=UPI0020A38346|nr:DUF1707 domain-containing protein [Actinomadura rupiterrae]MCP2343744.1 hypothetical protein [Actinomadura rupiterrae]